MAIITDSSPEELRNLVALVVDPCTEDLEALAAILRAHDLVVEATTSADAALMLASARRPDLIVVTHAPGSFDGCALARTVQAHHPQDAIPVVFLLPAHDEYTILQCYDAGGHDVVVKPVVATLMQARLRVILRLHEMRTTVAAQRDRLASYQSESERDKEVAGLIIGNVGAVETLEQPNVDYLLRPLETLNGDMMIAGRTPAGAHCFMVADFTGHGLPAAIGVLVAHGVFSAMVSRGHALDSIARELNRKMRQLLPRDRFLAAVLIEIYPDTGWTTVWNAGMPELLHRRADGSMARGFPSTSLPLGILEPDAFEPTPVRRQLDEGDLLFACSDGVIEMAGADGMFGLERVREVVAQTPPASLIATLDAALAEHAGGLPPHDDLSMLQVRFERDTMLAPPAGAARAQQVRPARHWRCLVEFGHDTLRQTDPVPLLGSLMDQLQGFGARTAEIFLILTELFSNALEHGLLALDSALKRDPSGFSNYYELREERLAALERGSISIELEHRPLADGGILDVVVRQSHAGHTHRAPTVVSLDENRGYAGRGIALVRSLCESLDYSDDGREARARYRWQDAASAAADAAKKKKAPG
ncbi:MAG: SpoIIE family protein phosphatase, partial [Gammaproteobacteria bacterium]